jgi:tetratricopeptide (TPR) repeat protein
MMNMDSTAPCRRSADRKGHEKKTAAAANWSCVFFVFFVVNILAFNGCATGATSAEEYFSIGMAYFEMGKFDEAEKWLNRAKMVKKTTVASEYNLGRIAFETGRYQEAAGHFEAILKRDPDNVLALKAAAYTRIKTGELDKADRFYRRVLALSPESADDGYNHALVLYAMEKYTEAEKVLEGYQFALLDNSDVLLLYARCQKALGKTEALDSYAKWLENNTDQKVRYEYAQMLETQEFYARALEEYRTALDGVSRGAADLKQADLCFAIARVLLIADGGNPEGIDELKNAVSAGFGDIAAMEKLLEDKRISAANRESLEAVINESRRALAEAARAQTENQAEDEDEAEE